MTYCISEHTVHYFLKIRCKSLEEFNDILNLRAYSTALVECPIPKPQAVQWNIESPSIQYSTFWMSDSKTSRNSIEYCLSEHTVQWLFDILRSEPLSILITRVRNLCQASNQYKKKLELRIPMFIALIRISLKKPLKTSSRAADPYFNCF